MSPLSLGGRLPVVNHSKKDLNIHRLLDLGHGSDDGRIKVDFQGRCGQRHDEAVARVLFADANFGVSVLLGLVKRLGIRLAVILGD